MKTIISAFALALLGMASASAQTDPLAAAAKEPGAVVTATGLVYRSLVPGTGPSPTAVDRVRVRYRGTFPDGKEFDSSGKETIEFPLNKVIKRWTEGVQHMKVGGKAKLTCPGPLGYPNGVPGAIPANAVLVFEVELVAIR